MPIKRIGVFSPKKRYLLPNDTHCESRVLASFVDQRIPLKLRLFVRPNNVRCQLRVFARLEIKDFRSNNACLFAPMTHIANKGIGTFCRSKISAQMAPICSPQWRTLSIKGIGKFCRSKISAHITLVCSPQWRTLSVTGIGTFCRSKISTQMAPICSRKWRTLSIKVIGTVCASKNSA